MFVSHFFRAYCMAVFAMKNITITLSEDLSQWLRVKAAEDNRSVSRWLAELIEGMRRNEDEYEIAMRRYLAMKPRKLGSPGGSKPTREELHDRSGLR